MFAKKQRIETRPVHVDSSLIKQNLAHIQERIDVAARKSGRTGTDVRLVVVTKNRTPEAISAAIAAGATDIGENRVQELLVKTPHIIGQARRHFIGTLQRNKVKPIIGSIDLIQSVDRLELAGEIDRRAAEAGLIQSSLVQCNVEGETTKQGIDPNDVEKVVAEIDKLGHIKIEGLMTIAPLARDEESARRTFAKLKQLYDTLTGRWHFKWLSMGMTEDFEVAVEEGANMVRIGRAVFTPVLKEAK